MVSDRRVTLGPSSGRRGEEAAPRQAIPEQVGRPIRPDRLATVLAGPVRWWRRTRSMADVLGRDRRELIAYHEAAHAVVGHRQGLTFSAIYVGDAGPAPGGPERPALCRRARRADLLGSSHQRGFSSDPRLVDPPFSCVAPDRGTPSTRAPGGKPRPLSANNRITLLVAHRHALIRQALRALLAAQRDIEVVAEASNGREAVEMAERLGPDVALVETRLPGISGTEATRLIRRRAGRTRVLLLALDADDELVVSVLRAGASGCVLLGADVGELLLAVRTTQRGGSYLPEAVAERMGHDEEERSSSAEGAPRRERLSVREREVLQLFAQGDGNKRIAEKLIVSVKTVEAHKAHIAHKLGVRGQTGLLKYAIRKGLIELDVDRPVAAVARSA
jgi:DNA-binding NarL/FixJ family response regulator